jgi:preprotein translocase subunit SecA
MPKKENFEREVEFKRALEEWQKKHDEVVALGGLHVIGTERHESRRIDNQLRGRSGRQGDPGSSRFFVSLDDDLMRIFGGDQIASLMTRFNMPEEIPLEHPMVSRSIEQAQIKVEGFNFDMRKRVVEYDDVMNKQREVIYRMRRKILGQIEEGENGKNLKEEILEEVGSEITNLVAMYSPEGYTEPEYEKALLGLCEIVPFDSKSQYELKTKISKLKAQGELTEFLQRLVVDIYQQREKAFGEELVREMEKYVYLTTIDGLWMDHLDAVDDLREGIGLRGYAQKDPLVEYKAEAFQMFERLIQQIKYEVVRKIFRIQVAVRPQIRPKNVVEEKKDIFGGSQIGPGQSQPGSETPKPRPVISGQKVGRNDPCPCGSGKKYKKCHLNSDLGR